MLLSFATDIFAKYWLLITTVCLTFVYHTCIKNWSFFTRNGVPFVRGLPIVGFVGPMLTGRAAFADIFREMYQRFPNDRFFGIYELFGKPTYVIRDPELAKQISIKDFEHFANHRTDVSPDNDPLLGRSMFVTRDDHWRTLRSMISPAFTGSKMRLMLSLIGETAQGFVEQLQQELNGRGRVLDALEVARCFTSDTIASAAFGLDVNSWVDRNNEFYRMGLSASNFGGVQGLKFIGYSSFPALMKLLKVSFFSKQQSQYFRDIVHDTIAHREKHGIVRHDMINLLIEAKKGKLFHNDALEAAQEADIGFATVQESNVGKASAVDHVWEDDDLVAQSMLFLLAGFTGVTHSIALLVNELAINQDIQQRLYNEIVEVQSKNQGKTITYETMQNMKYLDMVVSELLRRWSFATAQDRIVTKPYVMENNDGNKVQLNVGDGLWIPTYSIHLDPLYFPDPERFDPERFSDERKGDIVSGTYMPFGTGPRNCIGSRFALMEIKACMVYLLQSFKLVKCSKTMDPIRLMPGMNMMVQVKDGYWAEFKPRKV